MNTNKCRSKFSLIFCVCLYKSFIFISLTYLSYIPYTGTREEWIRRAWKKHMKLCNWILDRFIAFRHIFSFPVACFIAQSLYVLLSFLNNRYKWPWRLVDAAADPHKHRTLSSDWHLSFSGWEVWMWYNTDLEENYSRVTKIPRLDRILMDSCWNICINKQVLFVTGPY